MNTFVSTWQFWALLSAVFAALTAIFAKVGVEDIHPDVATFLRTLVIMLALMVLLYFSRSTTGKLVLSPRAIIFLVLSGLATAASWVCYFRALKIGAASRVAPVDKLSVILVAIFGVVFLGETLSPVHWTGVLLIGTGVVLMVSS